MSVSEKNSSVWGLLRNARVYKNFQTLLPKQSKADFVREELAFKAGEKVLDIGCGPAAILSSIPPETNYFGLDPNPKYIEHARNTFGSKGTFFLSGIQDFDLPEYYGTFDHVIALGVLHHLDDASARGLIKFAKQMLRPGGRILTVDPGRTTPQHPVARLLVNMDRGQHVRLEEDHRSLIEGVFDDFELSVRTDRMRVPYTHFHLKAFKEAS